MDNPVILIRPAVSFAFLKAFTLFLLTVVFVFLAYMLSPNFILFGIVTAGMAWYRFLYIRTSEYLVTPEMLRIQRGIFFKRVDFVELFRIKDYVVTQPLILRLLGLMDVTLRTQDAENPIIWLRGIPVSDLIETMRERVNDARLHNRIYEIN